MNQNMYFDDEERTYYDMDSVSNFIAKESYQNYHASASQQRASLDEQLSYYMNLVSNPYTYSKRPSITDLISTGALNPFVNHGLGKLVAESEQETDETTQEKQADPVEDVITLQDSPEPIAICDELKSPEAEKNQDDESKSSENEMVNKRYDLRSLKTKKKKKNQEDESKSPEVDMNQEEEPCMCPDGEKNHDEEPKSPEETIKEDEDGIYYCKVVNCDRSFTNKEERRKHTNNCTKKYSPRVKRYTCKFCKREFVTKPGVRKHEKTFHLKEKQYECPACGKCYLDMCSMRRHLKKHDNYRGLYL